MKKIEFKIKTESNVFIGGMPSTFEIGGIDQYTVTDQDGFPYIPGSSLKGAMRNMIENNDDKAEDIKKLYEEYIKKDEQKFQEQQHNLVKEDRKSDIQKRYTKALENVSAKYLFGIEGFNNTPKLFFNDLRLCDNSRDEKKCFSIDIKNSITYIKGEPASNPRTYKVINKNMMFEGYISMYNIKLLGKDAEQACEALITHVLKKFNDGIYRIGNSKSRGYGKIKVIFDESDGVTQHE